MSRAVPSGATPRHGTRRERKPKESHTDHTGGQPREEQPAGYLEPSLAGHRSCRQSSNSRDGPGPLQGPVRHLTPRLPAPRAYGRWRSTRRHHLVTQAGDCEGDTAILGIGDTSLLSTRPWAAAPGCAAYGY